MTDLMRSSDVLEGYPLHRGTEVFIPSRRKTFGCKLAGNQFNYNSNYYLKSAVYRSFQKKAKQFGQVINPGETNLLNSKIQMLLLQEKQGIV